LVGWPSSSQYCAEQRISTHRHKAKHGSEIEIEEAKEKKDKSCGYVLGFLPD
jgi:hypothetical protein